MGNEIWKETIFDMGQENDIICALRMKINANSGNLMIFGPLKED